jgi:hypothetical protein
MAAGKWIVCVDVAMENKTLKRCFVLASARQAVGVTYSEEDAKTMRG